MFEFVCYLVGVVAFVAAAFISADRAIKCIGAGLALVFLPPLINAAKAL